MLKELGQEAKRLKDNLTMTTKLKYRSLDQLKDLNMRYHQKIFANILTIQRWWRGFKQRMFFKTIVRKNLQREKLDHQSKVLEMERMVKEQEK